MTPLENVFGNLTLHTRNLIDLAPRKVTTLKGQYHGDFHIFGQKTAK